MLVPGMDLALAYPPWEGCVSQRLEDRQTSARATDSPPGRLVDFVESLD